MSCDQEGLVSSDPVSIQEPSRVSDGYSIYSGKVIRTYNTRWNDPEIQGKTVALDATLLTTKFFYSALMGDPLESKRIVVCWHR
jgi:hypothetical protein